jgi:hypothetical protein
MEVGRRRRWRIWMIFDRGRMVWERLGRLEKGRMSTSLGLEGLIMMDGLGRDGNRNPRGWAGCVR